MEQYAIKSVAFGGFDKQDVVRYIEQSAQEASSAQKALQEDNDTMKAQLAVLTEEAAALRGQVEELTALRKHLEEELSQVTAEKTALEPLREECAQWKSEAEALRPDAACYAQFRERLGAIECEARKRSDDLEISTAAQLLETVNLFRAQYQAMMSTFDANATYVTGELRKLEVTISQLPRAMDAAGLELNELASVLSRVQAEKSGE